MSFFLIFQSQQNPQQHHPSIPMASWNSSRNLNFRKEILAIVHHHGGITKKQTFPPAIFSLLRVNLFWIPKKVLYSVRILFRMSFMIVDRGTGTRLQGADMLPSWDDNAPPMASFQAVAEHRSKRPPRPEHDDREIEKLRARKIHYSSSRPPSSNSRQPSTKKHQRGPISTKYVSPFIKEAEQRAKERAKLHVKTHRKPTIVQNDWDQNTSADGLFDPNIKKREIFKIQPRQPPEHHSRLNKSISSTPPRAVRKSGPVREATYVESGTNPIESTYADHPRMTVRTEGVSGMVKSPPPPAPPPPPPQRAKPL